MQINKKEKLAYFIALVLGFGFAAWWLANMFLGHPNDRTHELYSDTYWVTALFGGVIGLAVAKQWGGLKSIFGKALTFLSFSLLAQVFGQVVYSYFALVKNIQAPYPSIGDIGFFGSIVLYIIAILYLSRAIGARFKKASLLQKGIAVTLPIAMLVASYGIFLHNYQFTGHPLTTFLDFGYPLGDAIYVSLALLAYILSRKLLGGKMKNKILFLLFALVIQYSADSSYLFRVSRNIYYAGDYSDFLYQVAYFLTTLALLRIGWINSKPANEERAEQ